MTIKRLDLDNWMGNPIDFEKCIEGEFVEIKPIFNKPGRYLHKGMEWFELPDGRAFKALKPGDFQWDLDHLNVKQQYNQRQIDALKMVVGQNVATEGQRRIVRMYEHNQEVKRVGRDTRMWVIRAKKEWTKKKEAK